MGKKRNKSNNYWVCIYCGKKFSDETLIEGEYIEHTVNGDVVECPSCGTPQYKEVV